MYSSYNSYIAYSNIRFLFGLLIVNYFASAFNIVPLVWLLNKRFVQISEFLLVCLCTYNIYNATRGVVRPLFETIDIPYKQYIFAGGPLYAQFKSTLEFLCKEWNNKSRVTPTAAKAAKESSKQPGRPEINDSSFTTLFSTKKPQTTANFSNVPSRTNERSILASTYPLQSAFGNVITPTSNKTPQSIDPATTEKTKEIKLKYTPCIKPPLKPTAHRERLLWYLSPTKEVVDDFRIEQTIAFQENWHKFNERASRVIYDRMTDILLKDIFKPLSASIDVYDKILSANGQSISNCSVNSMIYSALVPNNDAAFSLAHVNSFISLDGYLHPEGRQYVIERVKELASNNRMAAFRFTPKISGMPTDADIIMHIFKYYLSIREPYAIPPLIPHEGDLFKFLLIYIKITPELQHWKLFEE